MCVCTCIYGMGVILVNTYSLNRVKGCTKPLN